MIVIWYADTGICEFVESYFPSLHHKDLDQRPTNLDNVSKESYR